MSGADELVIVRTPLRISLGGGGTDLPFYSRQYGSDILTVAISWYVTVVAAHRSIDRQFRFSHETTALATAAEELDAPFMRSALALLGLSSPSEVTSLGEVPPGSGLGSSGAFAVSLLAALATLAGKTLSGMELAELGWTLEAEILNRPVGRQDHYACAFGGLRRLVIDQSGRVSSTPANVAREVAEALDRHLLLFYTGIRRDSSDHLRVPESDSARTDRIDQLHAIQTIGLQLRAALERGDVGRVGELLHEHWLIKRQRETSAFFDDCYAAGRDGGATGGKLVGAGGGGFLLLFGPPERHTTIIEAMAERQLSHVPFRFVPHGTAIATRHGWEGLT